jgi:predicted transcriptional regulator
MLNLQNVRVNVTLTRLALGPLEWQIMELVWGLEECSVGDIARKLPEGRAYTTIMTTLARLFQKGILSRKKVDRKFLYSARMSRHELEDAIAREFLAQLFAIPATSHARELITLSLLDGLRQQDSQFFEAAVVMTRARQSLNHGG